MERKSLNYCDREYMKMAMLKHEETFREQVSELHRLYRIQKKLMRDVTRNPPARPRLNLDLMDYISESGGKCRVSDIGDDLELTLGPRSYYHKKIEAAAAAGSNNMEGAGRSPTSEELKLSKQKWGLETMPMPMQVSNSPPWLFQTLRHDMIL